MNNFDQSSSGVNLELTCHFSCDLSQIYFYECFMKADHIKTRYGSNDVYHYIDYGNIGTIDPSSLDAYSYTKADLLSIFNGDEAMKEECAYYNDKPFSKCTKKDLVDYLESELPSDESYELYSKHLSPRFEVVEIRGYSQGDYAEIIVPDHFWTDAEIKKPADVQAYFEDMFTNLFYDTPLVCRLLVDGDEFHFDEYMNDVYRYDKEELLHIADHFITHDKKAYILEWLADNLPAYPDYK